MLCLLKAFIMNSSSGPAAPHRAQQTMPTAAAHPDESPLGVFKVPTDDHGDGNDNDDPLATMVVLSNSGGSDRAGGASLEEVLLLLLSDDDVTTKHAIKELHEIIQAAMDNVTTNTATTPSPSSSSLPLSPARLVSYVPSVINYVMQHIPGRHSDCDGFPEGNFLISYACASPDGALRVADSGGLYFLLAVLESAATQLRGETRIAAVDNVIYAIWIVIVFPSGAHVSSYDDSLEPLERVAKLLKELIAQEADEVKAAAAKTKSLWKVEMRNSCGAVIDYNDDDDDDNDAVSATLMGRRQRDEYVLALLVLLIDITELGSAFCYKMLLLQVFECIVNLLFVDAAVERPSLCERRLAAMRLVDRLMRNNAVEFIVLGGASHLVSILNHALPPLSSSADNGSIAATMPHECAEEVSAALHLIARIIDLSSLASGGELRERLAAVNCLQVVARTVVEVGASASSNVGDGDDYDDDCSSHLATTLADGIIVLSFLCDGCPNEAQVAAELASVDQFVEVVCVSLRQMPIQEVHRAVALLWFIAASSRSGRDSVVAHGLQSLIDLRRGSFARKESTTPAARTALIHNVVGCLSVLECFDSTNALLLID